MTAKLFLVPAHQLCWGNRRHRLPQSRLDGGSSFDGELLANDGPHQNLEIALGGLGANDGRCVNLCEACDDLALGDQVLHGFGLRRIHTVTLEHQTLASFQTMKILLAPDSFKGSLSATAVCSALATGLRRGHNNLDVIEHPLADGGEGTLDVLERAGFTRHSTRVHNSFGDMVTASLALRDTTAVIESAEAFTFLPDATPADALLASSAGVGELILAALDHRPEDIILFVGGTSGTDAGMGMLQALGAVARDSTGGAIAPGGAGLRDIATLDTTTLDSRLAGVRMTVASDVTNPLLGEHGAARIFAPQKGADPASVEVLEEGLTRVAHVMGSSYATLPGSGAGGGLAYGALAALGARIESGAGVLMAMSQFEDNLQGADLVITGEGSFDDQSVAGKITGAVISKAQDLEIPVVVVCGVSRITHPVPGVEVVEISAGQPNLQASMDRAGSLVQDAGERIARSIA